MHDLWELPSTLLFFLLCQTASVKLTCGTANTAGTVTRKRLNEMFLVHRIPYRLVIELSTPVSQKVLHGLLAMDP